LCETYQEAHKCGWINAKAFDLSNLSNSGKKSENSQISGNLKSGNFQQQKGKISGNENISGKSCPGCGHPGHRHRECKFRNHPNFNSNPSVAFQNTEAGKKVKRLNRAFDVNGKAIPQTKGMILASIANHLPFENALPCTIFTSSNELCIHALLDTGALQGNYVSVETANWVRTQGTNGLCPSLPADKDKLIDLAIHGFQAKSLGSIMFNLKYFNEQSKIQTELTCLHATVIDCPFDLIIGLPTIKRNSLAINLPSYFQSTLVELDSIMPYSGSVGQTNQGAQDMLSCDSAVSTTTRDEQVQRSRFRLALLTENKKHITDILTNTIDDQAFDLHQEYDFPWETKVEPSELDLLNKIDIQGDESLQNALRALCVEFSDIFSETVRLEPADIPPLEIEVDLSKWQTKANRGAPRPQSHENEQEILAQINAFLKLNVIKPAQVSEYSQVLLVPKANNSKRMCIDYRRLNDCTISRGWPIPHIIQMLNRVGRKKPKLFGKIDLTSGYHQAPLGEKAQQLAAFITFAGIYMYTRVPFGLKGAPAYFQQMIATVVLSGLMYFICEAYIDDILVYGSNNEEFLDRLRQVFLRFRKHKLTLIPSKKIT